ncbi:Bacteriophytochrome [compost metagenome]
MRLYDFILKHMEQILLAWEQYARTIDTALPTMDTKGLRNHAQFMLETVARDMRRIQTEQQQIAKSEGRAPQIDGDSPADTHARTRLVAGFSMDQMVSEYRALRSSVLRLWLAEYAFDETHRVDDMIRFNEAIDQALVESIRTYGEAVEATRKTVLGVLGHDLRSPLGAVMMASDLLRENDNLSDRERKLATQISTSVRRADLMVNDLLDLARVNLGTGLPVNVQPCELNSLCASVVEELRTGFPDVQLVLHASENISGQFDPSRMEQVFTNLIANAIRHGDAQQPIHVTLKRDGHRTVFSVQNHGELIPEQIMPYLFNPEGRYSSYASGEKGSSSGLGLGLFIAAQIVEGHGGSIEVQSTPDQGTTFTVLLPKA